MYYYKIFCFKKDKKTPLHVAAGEGHLSVVEVLIRSHADINAVDIVSQYIDIIKQFIRIIYVDISVCTHTIMFICT